MTEPSRGLCIGRADAGAAQLADALEVELHTAPAPSEEDLTATVETGGWAWTDSIETWAAELSVGEPLDQIAIVTWLPDRIL